MNPTTLRRPALAIAVLGLAAAHGVRAADVPVPLATIGTDEYATIQAAVDAAQPGDTVRVGAGEWHESVSVVLDDAADALTIDATDAVIDGGEASALTVTGPGSFRLVRGTLLSGATVLVAQGTDADALTLSVEDSAFRGTAGAIAVGRADVAMSLFGATTLFGDVVVARDCPTLVVAGLIAGGQGSGLVAERVGRADLSGMTVRNCGLDGVRFRGGTVSVRACSVSEFGRTGFDLRVSRSCLIDNCGTFGGGERGIAVGWSPGAEVLVRANRVSDAAFGIVAHGGNAALQYNRVDDAQRDGVTWRGRVTRGHFDGRTLGLLENHISNCGRSAIRLAGSGHRLIANTVALGDAGGAAVSGTGRIAVLRGNTVDGQKLR